MGFISTAQMRSLGEALGKSTYGQYLVELAGQG